MPSVAPGSQPYSLAYSSSTEIISPVIVAMTFEIQPVRLTYVLLLDNFNFLNVLLSELIPK
jgi:hypothetical protein